MKKDTIVRSLHDLGLGAWFGGTLAGAVALNGAASKIPDMHLRSEVANQGWNRWAPVNLIAIAAHLYGGFEIARRNVDRVHSQQGVGKNTQVKTLLTGLALAASGYARVLGKKIDKSGVVAVEGVTEPASTTPPAAAAAQKQLKVLQWSIPVLVGGIVISNALHGEQQKVSVAFRDVLRGTPLRGLAAKASGPAGVKETLAASVLGR